MKKTTENKSNPRLTALIMTLKDASRVHEVSIWREIARRLDAPRKNYAEVNLSKINRYANGDETILVPGKVLGSGVLNLPVKIAALDFSETAVSKITSANGTCMTIEDLVRDNPKGSKVRILR
ncbi:MULTISPECIES: 50S ribosomal protein L18e [Methanoculleus]|jgi:large subunit ribosomal protein L18e|uniref:Large ribosomal subunit protein eL18 n=1 Tax=Methanoculleus thermophilus TaxID=2200 RepID=A0A1G9C2T1_9EURY|nr:MULTISPECIES: 50S ribosomal protein L18e [Methanoculleus]NLN09852.1 50S ribosomal protein L18e [Methanoculleus thermophilus]SDK45997.1 LSU ribosomal protein L18AE [Methanoculleus thermophilus]HQD26824.1 50S ribosomal protein L18e [Methanoculleus thermophilus]